MSVFDLGYKTYWNSGLLVFNNQFSKGTKKPFLSKYCHHGQFLPDDIISGCI